jgi:glycosyltransferase involved in cell wall biosynthesis
MKIVHTLGWYFPESSGGTEVYVSGLARGLTSSGVEVIVAAPRDGDTGSSYQYDGIPIFRYPVSPTPSRDEAAGLSAPASLDHFRRWLEKQAPDVYHQHSWTRGCGVHHLQAARNLGLPIVTTLHVPAAFCLRDTMLLDGESVCDGRIDVARCTRCWGQARGIPAGIGSLLGRMPGSARRLSDALPDSMRFHTAAMTPALVVAHRDRFDRLVALSDRVVVVCEWLRDACIANGAPPQKLVLSRQGVDDRFAEGLPPAQAPRAAGPLRVGFLGRLDPVKGLDVLLDAVASLPLQTPIEVVIRGMRQDEEYARAVTGRVARDSRVRLAPPVSRAELATELEGYDLLAIPSRWLETGPLVALEALAAGVPVAASRRGGLAEIVRDPEDGWLLPPDDVPAWAALLSMLASDPSIARQLRHRRPVRRMRDVCGEMHAMYEEVLSTRNAGPTAFAVRSGDHAD